MTWWICQIISLIGCTLICVSCTQKDRHRYFLLQTIESVLSLFVLFLSGSYAGVVSIAASIVRTSLIYRNKYNIKFALLLSFVVCLTYKTPIDVLVIVGSLIYIFGTLSNSLVITKGVFSIALICYIIYDFHLGLYVYCVFNVISIALCIRYILQTGFGFMKTNRKECDVIDG